MNQSEKRLRIWVSEENSKFLDTIEQPISHYINQLLQEAREAQKDDANELPK